MTETLAPRGPDGSGTWTNGRVALGHRRLKVIDLSDDAMTSLLRVDLAEWLEALSGQEQLFGSYGARLPQGIKEEHETFMKENSPTPKVLDIHLTGAAARAEQGPEAFTGSVQDADAAA